MSCIACRTDVQSVLSTPPLGSVEWTCRFCGMDFHYTVPSNEHDAACAESESKVQVAEINAKMSKAAAFNRVWLALIGFLSFILLIVVGLLALSAKVN